jgi:hypothetical protein
MARGLLSLFVSALFVAPLAAADQVVGPDQEGKDKAAAFAEKTASPCLRAAAKQGEVVVRSQGRLQIAPLKVRTFHDSFCGGGFCYAWERTTCFLTIMKMPDGTVSIGCQTIE